MWLIIAALLVLAYSALTPLSDGLLDTSLWAAKIMLPAGLENNALTKQMLKFTQASLMEGWLSNVPFITTILAVAGAIAGFIHAWWAGILAILLLPLLTALTKLIWTQPVPHYLAYLYQKMVFRLADYKKTTDVERQKAAQSICEDLERILFIYQDCPFRPPSTRQNRSVPFGDVYYWLQHGATHS